ncbi:MAG: FAD-dependent oxidoreductase [Ruminococcaceae bacterium]|nr:FAD-dependent oxidoreductase [Oscillospiraceae bacterium]
MSRLDINTPSRAQTVVDGIYRDIERRIAASPPGLCPVDMALSFLSMCQAQTCGKCVPCRIGLSQLSTLITKVLDGEGTPETVALIEKTAENIVASADCAIGIEAAGIVLNGVRGFRDDYMEHVLNKRCLGSLENPVPCVALCPAGVDIPGYIALVHEGRFDDAVNLIRKDNPFPSACAYICEHPCEARCRRNMVDNAINIRALKRYAVDNQDYNNASKRHFPATGKHVAVVGGGPGGLSAAFFLSVMGHKVTVFEKRKQLGGMLRYGIPNYRLPREILDKEIAYILSAGADPIEVKTEVDVGKDIHYDELRKQFDSVYISIGAHTDKKVGIEGENSEGVISAVMLLRGIGDGEMPDFTGKKVVVIGGGNVAMDCVRSAIRLGAEKVSCVYRRRQKDMTALDEEIEGAIAEGAELCMLSSPQRIEVDENGRCAALWIQPQIIGEIGADGRPRPRNAEGKEQVRMPADVIIVAVGQGVETYAFDDVDIEIERGAISALPSSQLKNTEGFFAGGDCVTGPATVIRAIAAGKVAAANIDEYLGYRHIITTDVEIPSPRIGNKPPHGRINTLEREASERKHDFECIECGMSWPAAYQESSRCLRCDHYGYGIFKGGRKEKW